MEASNCSICGKQVLYRGLNSLECAGLKTECPNGNSEFAWPEKGFWYRSDKWGVFAHVVDCDKERALVVLRDAMDWPYYTEVQHFDRIWKICL